MNKARTLLTFHTLSVEVENTPGQEIIDHMHSTLMGQAGGLRYYHTSLKDKMMSGGENYFMYLRKTGKMLGSVGFCGRPSLTGGLAHDSWLIRYFSIKAPIQNVPKKRKEKDELRDEGKKSSIIGDFLQPVFADPTQLREGKQDPDQPSIIFGIIDQTNLRSMNFSSKVGLETVGVLAGFSFSRLRPRSSTRIEQPGAEEREGVLNQIREFYKDYTLFYPDPIFNNNDYYMIKEKGRMVAGIQTYAVNWKIMDFGSPAANRLVRIIIRIPFVKKRFSGEDISFLAFDAIYCEPGHEASLYELMEGVLERTGNYIGMMMMDQQTKVYRIFQTQKKLGIMNKVMGTYHADIRVRFNNIPDPVRQQFYDRPTYIPTYDNS